MKRISELARLYRDLRADLENLGIHPDRYSIGWNNSGEGTVSTNIETLAVKKLDNFIVPLLETSTLFDDGAEILEYSPLKLRFTGGCEAGELIGTVVDSNRVMLESLDWGGEASGSMFDQFELLLSRSTGTMKAVIVWEDSEIERLVVVDGQVSISSVDLGDLV